MERKHAIIIIKNSNNEYLQYYDERWNSYLFLNCKIENQFDIEKIENEVKRKLDVSEIKVSYIMDKIHTKFSESDKIDKEYHHYFFTVIIENKNEQMLRKEFIINNIKFKWYSYEQLLRDERIQKVNSDIVNFVKETERNKEILEKCLPIYLEKDLNNLKEGIKNNVSYLDCLIDELQGSINSAYVDGEISEEQCDYLYKKYIRMEKEND